MMRLLSLIACVCAATWHAWRWYLNRIWVAPEEGAALVLSLVFVAALALRQRKGGTPGPAIVLPWAAVSGALMLYAASFYTPLPPIGRAAIAISTALACLYSGLIGSRPPIAFWGLICLSLPVLPSLQVTFGYPLRIVSAAATVSLLNAQGLDVARQGTFLVWRGEMVQFDAPCSGINMLWAGLIIAFMGCVSQRFGTGRTALAVAACVVFTLAGNILRASSLFYVEAGLIAGIAPSVHEAIGIAAFVLAALGLILVLASLEPKRETAP